MKLGITGLTGSGKKTVFEAMTRNISDAGHKSEDRIGTIRVPDSRVDILSDMYKPRKTIYAQVEYFLPGMPVHKEKTDQNVWTPVRDCDALIHVVRNFGGYGFESPEPYKDFLALDQELVLADLVVVEKRLERLESDKKRGKTVEQEEISLLNECLKHLESEVPLRKFPELASARLLRGYAFLSAKPMLVLFNNEDDDDHLPDADSWENCMLIRGKLEQELAQMSDEEAEDFLAEFNISASATDRVIGQSYELLGLISFFTVGEDEVRAWTIKKETPALDAAGAIHSDIKKGFIRAEVLSYNDLMEANTYSEARKRGTVRLEGKTYQVQDGDIINFRFNV
ncbi:DUF933 domain-containing protein [Desulfococcaceae bacterium HSG8]|nr:DUF933 domain-containing protein [Desulfococcaceae bacterium HSG8]